jgi:hypothetical protein
MTSSEPSQPLRHTHGSSSPVLLCLFALLNQSTIDSGQRDLLPNGGMVTISRTMVGGICTISHPTSLLCRSFSAEDLRYAGQDPVRMSSMGKKTLHLYNLHWQVLHNSRSGPNDRTHGRNLTANCFHAAITSLHEGKYVYISPLGYPISPENFPSFNQAFQCKGQILLHFAESGGVQA